MVTSDYFSFSTQLFSLELIVLNFLFPWVFIYLSLIRLLTSHQLSKTPLKAARLITHSLHFSFLKKGLIELYESFNSEWQYSRSVAQLSGDILSGISFVFSSGPSILFNLPWLNLQVSWKCMTGGCLEMLYVTLTHWLAVNRNLDQDSFLSDCLSHYLLVSSVVLKKCEAF